MLSVNDTLSRAYFATLSSIEYLGNPVPVYKNQLPTDIAPGLYIIFGRMRSQDISPKTSSSTNTTVTVSIYTNSLKYIDGVAVDIIGNEVLNRLYKVQSFNINLNSQFLQVNQTTLQQDFIQDYSVDKQNVYIDRIMIFAHTIFQNIS